MAFAWVRIKNLLRNYFDHGEIIVGITVTRFTRDRDEFRRLSPPRGAVSFALGTIDVVEAVVFAIAAIVVSITSTAESPPNKPMRFWVAVYALQCIVHLAWLYMQRFRRQQCEHFLRNNVNMSMRNVEYAKEIMFLCWWTLGCHWLLQSSTNSAPQITWLSGVFLFFDIFLFFFALTLASILGLVLCCFLPLIYAFFYILGEQVHDALPPCPFCECSIHKSTIRFT